MKLAMRLTMKGLIRALQGRAHDLAEDLERRQIRNGPERLVRPTRASVTRGGTDGVRRD